METSELMHCMAATQTVLDSQRGMEKCPRAIKYNKINAAIK